jgi:hypothetical protein
MSIAFCTVGKNFPTYRTFFREPARKQMMAAVWNARTAMMADTITSPVVWAALVRHSTSVEACYEYCQQYLQANNPIRVGKRTQKRLWHSH